MKLDALDGKCPHCGTDSRDLSALGLIKNMTIADKDTAIQLLREQLSAVNAERDELLAGLKALYEAMIRYEGDVGGDAPQEHHEMMRSVAKIIAKGGKNA